MIRPHAPARALHAVCVCAVAAGLVAGCAMGHDYQRPEVALPDSFRTPAVDAVDAVDSVDAAWWQGFSDPHLARLVDQALDTNRDLQIAAAKIEQFDARLDISGADRYPSVTAGGQVLRERVTEQRAVDLPLGAKPTFSTFSGNFSASWEVDLWGRVKRANEAALADLAASEEARRGVMLTVATAVATTYIQLLGLDQQLELLRQAVANREAYLELARTKYEGGSGTLLGVIEARDAVDQQAAQIPGLEGQAQLLENALSELAGRAPGTIPRGTMATLKLPPLPAGLPSDLLARRPDVLQAEQALIAANARVALARLQYFPTISLTGILGNASDQLDTLAKRSATFGQIGPSLLATIFDGGRIEASIRENEAVQREMLASYRKAIDTALREVDDALVTRSKSVAQGVVLERQVGNMQELVRLTQLRFEGGQSTSQDVLDAERRLNDARRAGGEGKGDQVAALIAVYKAMGGGWMLEQEMQRAATWRGDHDPTSAVPSLAPDLEAAR